MNRNADLGYHGRRNLSTISVRQLPGLNSQRRKSPRAGTSPIRQNRAPDPDRSQPARNALAHPRPFRGLFPSRGPVETPSRTPTSIGFSAYRPEPALNSKCSMVRSCRGVISPRFSFGTACLRTSLQNLNSCTPPQQQWKGQMPEEP